VHLAYIWIVCYLSAKNYQNQWKFDAVLTKTNLLSFFLRLSVLLDLLEHRVHSSLFTASMLYELLTYLIVGPLCLTV